jgi:hypothetical protein
MKTRLSALFTTLLFFSALTLTSAQSSSAPSAAEPRLTEDESRLLSALSDVCFYRNQFQDMGMARMQVFENFRESPDPLLRNIAESAFLFNDAIKLAQFGPSQQETLNAFGNDWKRFVSQTVSEAILSSMTGQSGSSSSDFMRQVEQMGAGPQNQAIWNRSMTCLRNGVRKTMREHAAALMESRDAGRPQASGAMLIRLTVKDGEVWMNVTNRTIRPLHHCLITTRREQDAAKVDEQKKHSAIAAGLGFILGMSNEANARNVLQGNLLLETQKLEQGALIFVPELQPNESVSFAMAGTSHLEYTTGIYASLWCDEGKELNALANLQALNRAAAGN